MSDAELKKINPHHELEEDLAIETIDKFLKEKGLKQSKIKTAEQKYPDDIDKENQLQMLRELVEEQKQQEHSCNESK